MLEDWESHAVPSHHFAPEQQGRHLPFPDEDESFDASGGGTATAGGPSEKGRLFSIDVLERNAARGHGSITCVTAGNNVLLLGTSRGWLIRHDFGASGDVVEIDLTVPRWGEQSVHRVFLDPSGNHALTSVRSSLGETETYYMHARWKKARALPRLKGLVVNAVGWHRQQVSEASTRDIVVGTLGGQLLDVQVDEKDKREKCVRPLYELPDSKEPICALQMETVGGGANMRYHVMAATPTRLYTFQGTGSLEATFAAYARGAPRFTELPGPFPNSEVHLYGKHQRRAEWYAWMAGPGVCHGHLNLNIPPTVQTPGSSSKEGALLPAGGSDTKWLLEYAKLAGPEESSSRPLSMAVSEFHFLLLYPHRLKVVNRVSQHVVEEERVGPRLEVGPRGLLGLVADTAASAFYAFSDSSIYEISAQDEGRDMWRVHLERREYAAALSHCSDASQRDRVYAAQAEAAFAAGDYSRAASFYAKTANVATFEEVALKFVAVGEQDALRTYLLHKLDRLGKEDKSQSTIIATWAAELYLDKINRLLMDGAQEDAAQAEGGRPPGGASSSSSEYAHVVQEFRAFLSDCNAMLDEATTVKLLNSYGREEEAMHYAELRGQHDTVVHYHLQRGDAKKAIAVLRRPGVPVELQYKYAAALMALDAASAVETWMVAGTALQPRRLIPALTRCSSLPTPSAAPRAAIEYLEFCVGKLKSEDSAVHNLLLSLYVKQGDESALLRFLSTPRGEPEGGAAAAAAAGAAGPASPAVLYDPKYALRLCLEHRQLRACVAIYSLLAMHHEAVALALQVDLDLAKAEADKVGDAEGGGADGAESQELRKRLWLMVARHVIEQERSSSGGGHPPPDGSGGGGGGGERGQGGNIRKAIAFLKETNGLLKIEDILPFFPDFTLIDDFKEAICASLEDYKGQIEELKREMGEATAGADSIRRDMSALTQRYAVVRTHDACALCGRLLLAAAGGGAASGKGGGSGAGVGRGGGGGGGGVAAAEVVPFYVFPCEHAFHTDCLTTHVLQHSDAGERDKIDALRRRLASLAASGGAGASSGNRLGLAADNTWDSADAQVAESPIEKARQQLDAAVAGECPFCGELMIRSVSEPFVRANDAELPDWEIQFGALSVQ